MGWFGWLKGRKSVGGDPRLSAWRAGWQEACGEPTGARLEALTAQLNALALPEEEIEIEREMLAGLEQLVSLHSAVASGTLPVIPTGHRVVGTDACHFSAPCSMPDEASEPSGRLIFTNARAIFAGGAASIAIPWHAVAKVLQQHRDVMLIRRDRETLYRFRCNAFADALSAALLARTLSSRRPSV
jgi:hypothetical protein